MESDVRRAITDALDASSTANRLNERLLLQPPPIKPILDDRIKKKLET